jgi:hypothetical protein
MEFAVKTLVVFALLVIATIVIILFMNVWSGKSMNVLESAYDFFNNIIGIGGNG